MTVTTYHTLPHDHGYLLVLSNTTMYVFSCLKTFLLAWPSFGAVNRAIIQTAYNSVLRYMHMYMYVHTLIYMYMQYK